MRASASPFALMGSVSLSRKEATCLSVICVAAILTKVALLLTSESALDSDEAILGLMATHIQQGLSHPLFFYGQSYDAGSGVIAHVDAIGHPSIAVDVEGKVGSHNRL